LLSSVGTLPNFYLRIGEGAGPTWETGAHYTVIQMYNFTGSSGAGGSNSTTATDILNGDVLSQTSPLSVKLYIDNVGSSSVVKRITESDISTSSGPTYNGQNTWAFWNNDTNPITGLELVPSSGNIASGTCTLYGMN
jgi:hypothetical protein